MQYSNPTATLQQIRYETGSQCNTSRMYAEIWVLIGVRPMRRTADQRTQPRQRISPSGRPTRIELQWSSLPPPSQINWVLETFKRKRLEANQTKLTFTVETANRVGRGIGVSFASACRVTWPTAASCFLRKLIVVEVQHKLRNSYTRLVPYWTRVHPKYMSQTAVESLLKMATMNFGFPLIFRRRLTGYRLIPFTNQGVARRQSVALPLLLVLLPVWFVWRCRHKDTERNDDSTEPVLGQRRFLHDARTNNRCRPIFKVTTERLLHRGEMLLLKSVALLNA